jgi:hypothetical protein
VGERASLIKLSQELKKIYGSLANLTLQTHHFDFHLNSQLWVLKICSSHQGTFPATFDAMTK